MSGVFRVSVNDPHTLFVGFAADAESEATGHDVTLTEAQRMVDVLQRALAAAREMQHNGGKMPASRWEELQAGTEADALAGRGRPTCDRTWGRCACGVTHVPCPDFDR